MFSLLTKSSAEKHRQPKRDDKRALLQSQHSRFFCLSMVYSSTICQCVEPTSPNRHYSGVQLFTTKQSSYQHNNGGSQLKNTMLSKDVGRLTAGNYEPRHKYMGQCSLNASFCLFVRLRISADEMKLRK